MTALIHAVVGIISQTDWGDDPQVLIGGFMLLTSVTMLYIAFFMEGRPGKTYRRNCRTCLGLVRDCMCYGSDLAIGTGDTMEMTFENIPLVIWGLTAPVECCTAASKTFYQVKANNRAKAAAVSYARLNREASRQLAHVREYQR